MTRHMPWRRGFVLWVSVFVAMLLLGMASVGCRSDDTDDYTPPPATIIRASDSAEATVTLGAVPATTRPVPPTRPPTSTPASSERDYPIPAGTPRDTPTPIVYPSKQ